MSEGAGLKDVPFLCKDMIDVSTEKQRRKQKKRQRGYPSQPSPMPIEKRFLHRHLDTDGAR